jgi:hypothetical protein
LNTLGDKHRPLSRGHSALVYALALGRKEPSGSGSPTTDSISVPVVKGLEKRARDASHGGEHTPAKQLGISRSRMQRARKTQGLEHDQIETCKVGRALQFVEEHTDDPKPLAWSTKTEEIISKGSCAARTR